jgi:hypothetical protein
MRTYKITSLDTATKSCYNSNYIERRKVMTAEEIALGILLVAFVALAMLYQRSRQQPHDKDDQHTPLMW